MNLPEVPDCKKWKGKSTPEQDVLQKLQDGKKITKEEVDILDCAFRFYGKAFNAMRSVDLSRINHRQADLLKRYLLDVINVELIFQNPVTVNTVYRMTWVEDFNEENGKVRDTKFLSLTPLEVVKEKKKLGRANTNETTCLYLAETPQVAVYECKPAPDDRIIITAWRSIENKPLIMYPVNTPEKVNQSVLKATNALDQHLDLSNPHVAKIIKVIQNFIGSEFIKDDPVTNEFRYEYLYSAYFADKVMNSKIEIPDEHNDLLFGQYDGIIYPSIATQYNYNNLAVRESSVPKLTPFSCREYLVCKPLYENFDGDENHLPFEGHLIRTSKSIGNQIIWDDD